MKRPLSFSLTLITFALAIPTALAADGWQSFEARMGPGLHRRAGGPSSRDVEAVGAVRAWSAFDDARDLDDASRVVLEAAEELIGARAADLFETRRVDVAGLHVIQLEQRVGGLTVRGSFVEMSFLDDGTLTVLRARSIAPDGPLEPFAVLAADAGELARLALPDLDMDRLWSHPPRRMAQVVAGRGLRPVWIVDVWDPTRPGAEWRVAIDGADGSLVDTQPLALDAVTGTVDGRGAWGGPQTTAPILASPTRHAYVYASDSASAVTRITTNACGDTQVAMSADASRVAWVSSCDGDREVWVANADGTGAMQLTSNAAADHSPAISADGSRIVFVSESDGDPELWSIESDGSGLTQLTFNSAREQTPSLSGDGARVAYVSDLDGDTELFTLLVATPAPVQLSFDATRDAAPRISSDGSRIVWVSWSDGDGEIRTIPSAGGASTQVTVNSVEDSQPDITGDGSRVVFASRLSTEDPVGVPAATPAASPLRSALGASRDLFECAFDGSDLKRITFSGADESDPSYASGGGCVAYVTTEDGDADIEVLDLASGGVVRWVDNTTSDRAPSVSGTCCAGAWVGSDPDAEIFVWNCSAPGAFAATVTSATGAYSLALPDALSPTISTGLNGKYARVVDLDPRWNNERAVASAITPAAGVALHLNPTGSVEGPTAQVTAYDHVNLGHDALEAVMTRPPLSMAGPLPIDAPVLVRANFPSPVANAFYSLTQQDLTFFVGGGPSRPNTAYDTVVLHEHGHYVDDLLGGLSGGSTCEAFGSQSEGIGDAEAMFVTGQTIVGEDFFGAGAHLRDYGTFRWVAAGGAMGRQYDCKDCAIVGGKPEVHDHGEAFAGFLWDLRTYAGATSAENLFVATMLTNPPDMQAAVLAMFSIASTPAFGGTGDPVTSPLFDALFAAASRHGFDSFPRSDWASHGCAHGVCGPTQPVHRTIGTEWLGAVVVREATCEPIPSGEDDGTSVPGILTAGAPLGLTVTLKVDPRMKGSGRYGAPVVAPPVPPANAQLPWRRVYLNAWVLVDMGAGTWVPHKVLGLGSASPTTGPNNIGAGNMVAFNPDTWAGTSLSFPVTITPPPTDTPRTAILRFRLDYGEDAGRLSTCLSDPTLSGPCGVARFGEVEDYQFALMP